VNRRIGTVNVRRATITLWLAGTVLGGVSCRDADVAGPSETSEAIGTAASLSAGTGATAALSFRQVSAGATFTCGTSNDNRGYCWGGNGQGEVGDGTTTRRLTPVPVAGGLLFRQISAGFYHACGVTTEDRAYCWGDNQFGELGNGEGLISSPTPVPVVGELSFRQISAGGLHTCGVTRDNLAYCWGKNDGGQLGIGSAGSDQYVPAPVVGGLRFRQVSATGANHNCGVTTAGRAYCWGYNHGGQLGDGSTTTRYAPVAVRGGLEFRAVSVGTYYTCGVTLGNRAYCWGENFRGQLGDGTTTRRLRPVAVAGGQRFVKVSSGDNHACAINPFDRAFCWGWNGAGNLGDGTTTQRLIPVRVSGGLPFRQLTASPWNHTCGVTPDDRAYCWGSNNFYGKLGDGTLKNSRRPVPVADPH
jgi:alpha-tubulin suppressor-like RCC1 family protein